MKAVSIRICGIVQGVGFRPTVYRLAVEHGVRGFVRNDSGGVTIRAEGDGVAAFISALADGAPRASTIETMEVEDVEPEGFADFRIVESERLEGEVTSISPDLATCPDCLRELFDPDDRRFGYPFINCTHCGPRYSIIRELPYDRRFTSMSEFPMCADCRAEYEDVSDRRFHAQPNACELCGPRYELLDRDGEPIICDDPIGRVGDLLGAGKIVAVKGIGGFHLMADAQNETAIDELRRRKTRPHKPFAVMVDGLESARKICELSTMEGNILASPAAPILLLKRLRDPMSILPESIAPRLDRLGLFLAYAPVHHLIFAASGLRALIATSGNRRDEPIVCRNDEAIRELRGIADVFLVHNREIVGRTDDSVGFVFDGAMTVVRRSRGYVPRSIRLPISGPPVLAVGADLKGTFCITRGGDAFLSPFLGDMAGEKSAILFDELLDRYLDWLKVRPEAIVCDLHPDYISTMKAERIAERLDVPLFRVQHHFAHALSVVAEHRLPDEASLAISLDGYGYGGDGTIWGAEFLIFDYDGFERVGHIFDVPQPGGDRAAIDARRMALSWLHAAFGDRAADALPALFASLGELAEPLLKMISERRPPIASSAGRLFDTMACISGICCENTYEGECPQRLMAAFDPSIEGRYGFDFDGKVLDPRRAIRAAVLDISSGKRAATVATRFHRGFARGLVDAATKICARRSIRSVILSGGVFQNEVLLKLVVEGLRNEGLSPNWNRSSPPGDAGVALGQALFGLKRFFES